MFHTYSFSFAGGKSSRDLLHNNTYDYKAQIECSQILWIDTRIPLPIYLQSLKEKKKKKTSRNPANSHLHNKRPNKLGVVFKLSPSLTSVYSAIEKPPFTTRVTTRVRPVISTMPTFMKLFKNFSSQSGITQSVQ